MYSLEHLNLKLHIISSLFTKITMYNAFKFLYYDTVLYKNTGIFVYSQMQHCQCTAPTYIIDLLKPTEMRAYAYTYTEERSYYYRLL